MCLHSYSCEDKLCKNVVLRGCGKLQGAFSYFPATESSQMDVEAAIGVDLKYKLNPCSIISVQVQTNWRQYLGRRCMSVYSNICVVAR